jgi:hypothetical protein
MPQDYYLTGSSNESNYDRDLDRDYPRHETLGPGDITDCFSGQDKDGELETTDTDVLPNPGNQLKGDSVKDTSCHERSHILLWHRRSRDRVPGLTIPTSFFYPVTDFLVTSS